MRHAEFTNFSPQNERVNLNDTLGVEGNPITPEQISALATGIMSRIESRTLDHTLASALVEGINNL